MKICILILRGRDFNRSNSRTNISALQCGLLPNRHPGGPGTKCYSYGPDRLHDDLIRKKMAQVFPAAVALAKLEDSTSLPPGPTGLQPLPDMLARLSRVPVVSIVSIRGRATGVGSELALASDMRFASREKAILSQWEVGAGLVPGGGPMARLPRLIGRGRAEPGRGRCRSRFRRGARETPDIATMGKRTAFAPSNHHRRSGKISA